MRKPVTLLIPEKADIEFEQVFAAWTNGNGRIKRLGKYWIKDEELAKEEIAIYGNQTFSLVLAHIYDIELISPDDTLIARLDREWTKRSIHLRQIGQIAESDFPVFIKPVIPKLFLAGIFKTHAEFRQATNGLGSEEEILVSDIVEGIQAEARSYVKTGELKDIALYEGSADLESGRNFVVDFLRNNKNELPAVVVIDVAFSEQTGWFILEFNACWGAGLNNCKAEKVIECIVGATVKKR